MPAAASSPTWLADIRGQLGPSSHWFDPPRRPEMMYMLAVKPCRCSSGTAASSTFTYPSSKVMPTSPRARPARISSTSVPMPTPRRPRRFSQVICSANRSGATQRWLGSSAHPPHRGTSRSSARRPGGAGRTSTGVAAGFAGARPRRRLTTGSLGRQVRASGPSRPPRGGRPRARRAGYRRRSA